MSFFSKATARLTAAASALAFTAAAAVAEPMNDFYLTVTSNAFDATYGDSLTPDAIQTAVEVAHPDFADLSDADKATTYGNAIHAAVGGTAVTYQDNYVGAARDYFETLSASDLEALAARIEGYAGDPSWAQDTWTKVVAEDAGRYVGNWQTPLLEEGSTNPLFYAFQTLANDDRNMLTQGEVITLVNGARGLTHGGDNLARINARVVEAAEEVLSAAPAPAAPAPAGRALNPFD